MTAQPVDETQTSGGFVAHEYAAVRAPREFDAVYRDSYAAFGWSVEDAEPSTLVPGALVPGSLAQTGSVTFRLRRDRRIKNRQMVQTLQRKAEGSLSAIVRLERSKNAVALAVAVSVGIVGCAFLAGSVFSIEGGLLVLSIVLGAVGLLAWLAGYLAYLGVRSMRTAKVAPLIDSEFEALYEACEQAAQLLR